MTLIQLMDRLARSFRIVLRHKRFTALATLSLAVAIALNTTMYSVLDALVNPRIDMFEPERLYSLQYFGDYRGRVPRELKFEMLTALRSFEAVGGTIRSTQWQEESIAERGDAVFDPRVRTVTVNYFPLTGVQPLAGRLLVPADAAAEPRPVVVSERFWKTVFPERRQLDTATFLLGGTPRAVVGVLSSESDFPRAFTDIWQFQHPSAAQGTWLGWGLVRIRPDVTPAQAHAELRVLADRWAALAGDDPRYVSFRMREVAGDSFQLRAFHLALIGAVLAVLLVACVNLANMQLARGITRARELATRAAIGASRRDLLLDLVCEALWIALAGLVLGLLLTLWAMRIVEHSVPPSLAEYVVRPHMNWRVIGASVGIAGFCLLVVGLLPALRASRVDISEVIKSGAGTGRTLKARRVYGSLVVLQLALALALMAGGTLLLRSAAHLYRMDTPERFERTLFGSLRISPLPTSPIDFNARPPAGTTEPVRRDPRRLVDPTAVALDRIRALPDVEAAGTAIRRSPAGYTIALADAGGQARQVITGLSFSYQVVSPDYPRAVGMTLHRGRLFQEGEFAEPLVIVDDQTARYLWPGQDAVGQRIKLARDTARAPWLEVIGVVRHFNFWRPFDRTDQTERMAARMGAVFVLQGGDTTTVGRGQQVDVVVTARAGSAVPSLPLRVRDAVLNPGSGTSLPYLQTWLRSTGLDVLRERSNFIAALFAVFALVALGVASLGVYAIVAHSVSQRTREFGVRIALGATMRDVRTSVLREGNILALSGVALGLCVIALTAGWLGAFLRSATDQYDSPLFAVVALVLYGVAILASWIQARRAMRINPVEALRND